MHVVSMALAAKHHAAVDADDTAKCAFALAAAAIVATATVDEHPRCLCCCAIASGCVLDAFAANYERAGCYLIVTVELLLLAGNCSEAAVQRRTGGLRVLRADIVRSDALAVQHLSGVEHLLVAAEHSETR